MMWVLLVALIVGMVLSLWPGTIVWTVGPVRIKLGDIGPLSKRRLLVGCAGLTLMLLVVFV